MVVFKDLSFSLPQGRVIGLLGENGIGKTTLLRLIARFMMPDSGEILIDGQKVSRQTKTKVSFLLEPPSFYSFMCVKDAVQYYKDFFHDFNYEKAIGLCKEYKLGLNRRIKYLSKGNKERLCLLLCLYRQ
jgi:ABC-2 type transport system ATP-binding protein